MALIWESKEANKRNRSATPLACMLGMFGILFKTAYSSVSFIHDFTVTTDEALRGMTNSRPTLVRRDCL